MIGGSGDPYSSVKATSLELSKKGVTESEAEAVRCQTPIQKRRPYLIFVIDARHQAFFESEIKDRARSVDKIVPGTDSMIWSVEMAETHEELAGKEEPVSIMHQANTGTCQIVRLG